MGEFCLHVDLGHPSAYAKLLYCSAGSFILRMPAPDFNILFSNILPLDYCLLPSPLQVPMYSMCSFCSFGPWIIDCSKQFRLLPFLKKGDAKPKTDFGLNIVNIVRDCRILEAVENMITCRWCFSFFIVLWSRLKHNIEWLEGKEEKVCIIGKRWNVVCVLHLLKLQFWKFNCKGVGTANLPEWPLKCSGLSSSTWIFWLWSIPHSSPLQRGFKENFSLHYSLRSVEADWLHTSVRSLASKPHDFYTF